MLDTDEVRGFFFSTFHFFFLGNEVKIFGFVFSLSEFSRGRPITIVLWQWQPKELTTISVLFILKHFKDSPSNIIIEIFFNLVCKPSIDDFGAINDGEDGVLTH